MKVTKSYMKVTEQVVYRPVTRGGAGGEAPT